MKTSNRNEQLPFYNKPMPEVGKYQGVGIPGKYGARPGTFTTYKKNRSFKLPNATPPLKFN